MGPFAALALRDKRPFPARMGIVLELHRNRQYTLRCNFERHLVLLVRSPAPYESIEEIETTVDRMVRSLARIDRPRFVLFVDLRQGPMRTDAEFEAAFAPRRRQLIAGFSKVAIVARTLSGRAQVQRNARADKAVVRDFADPEQALAYLGITAADIA